MSPRDPAHWGARTSLATVTGGCARARWGDPRGVARREAGGEREVCFRAVRIDRGSLCQQMVT
jgi:hypothetical protein